MSVFAVLVQEDVLSRTECELDNVPFEKFDVFLGLDFLVVDKSTVGRFQVDDIRPDTFTLVAVGPGVRHEPVLQDGVLFTAARVVHR